MVATRAQVMESLQKKVEYIEASITTKVEEEINKALGPIHHILKDKYHPGEGNHVDAKIEGEFVHHKSEGYHNFHGGDLYFGNRTPKIDMHKFEYSKLEVWEAQME